MSPLISRIATCTALVLGAVLAPAVAQTALAAPTAQATACTEEGYFPHESDFTKFYRCYEAGDSLHRADFDCPPGTVYDTDLPPGNCNHSWALNPSNPAYQSPNND
ncbi:chitin binding peritrophin-A domain-containing protein [Streptomyces sp. NPDC048424]|uniref:chitin binding peritrophin-A domain-containing protein n=1 Tax=Streptomyces sp. NPDC048424 TaxID=3155265 RepID=UPI00342A08FD